MPYTAQHKHETRTRIIQSARRLFNRNGFADVTIDQIMDEAGLTHGGFYKHFAAKEELYAAAVLQFICNEVPEKWQRDHIHPDARGTALARMIVDAYLSDEHFADRDASCPMIALPSDVARGNGAVKDAFRQVLEMMLRAFEAAAPEAHDAGGKGRAPPQRCAAGDHGAHGVGARLARLNRKARAMPVSSPVNAALNKPLLPWHSGRRQTVVRPSMAARRLIA
jgi:AcrR family transcriptional regulator